MFRRLLLPLGLLARIALMLGVLWLVLCTFIKVSAQLSPPNFEKVAHNAWSFLLFCLGVGGVTMATVQIWRTLIPVRGYFHRGAMLDWLQKHSATSPSAWWDDVRTELGTPSVSPYEALREFEGRSQVGSETPGAQAPSVEWGWKDLFRVPQIYDLPIEQLCGQLTVAFESAVDHPKRFASFLLLVAGPNAADDLLRLAKSAESPLVSPDQSISIADSQAQSSLTRFGHIRIEVFQIDAGGRWRRYLRLVVLAVSFAYTWMIASGGTLEFLVGLKYLAYSVPLGFVGGYIAMVLRDLTAIVELKRRAA